MTFQERSLRWIDMQGYRLTDDEKRRLTVPIKFAPGLCATFAAIFLATTWMPGLSALAATALAGAVLPRHPFDYIYLRLVEPVVRTGAAPTNTPQRRFACSMAAVMLFGAAIGFWLDIDLLAWLLGLSFLAAATTVTLTNWCLPSFIYGLIARPLRLPIEQVPR